MYPRGKRTGEPSESSRSPPPMDTRGPRGVINASLASDRNRVSVGRGTDGMRVGGKALKAYIIGTHRSTIALDKVRSRYLLVCKQRSNPKPPLLPKPLLYCSLRHNRYTSHCIQLSELPMSPYPPVRCCPSVLRVIRSTSRMFKTDRYNHSRSTRQSVNSAIEAPS
ncbi:hypothetical protein EVAR_53681_1 [Eumeta japonica]|uniref:Uncharacterized protein n=1 Tax=Eumeta variegata TaxID=151549 RepID=A0A4C1YLH8_EUMVA|nr:hypothetical protein EVAR_53681_1 [Eumeta japonica]